MHAIDFFALLPSNEIVTQVYSIKFVIADTIAYSQTGHHNQELFFDFMRSGVVSSAGRTLQPPQRTLD